MDGNCPEQHRLVLGNAQSQHRPSTQNEVTYDLKAGEPTSLTFRGVKLEILEAGNDGMKLRIGAGSR